MRKLRLLLIPTCFLTFNTVAQQEAPPLDIKLKPKPNHTFALHFRITPRFRFSYSTIYDRISFTGAVLFDTGVQDNYRLEHNNLPKAYTDSSMIFDYRNNAEKAFELQFGIGNGRQRTFYTDDEGLPQWFFKWGGQFTFGRYFYESTHGEVSVNYSIDTLNNNYQYTDVEGNNTSNIFTARRDILSRENSTLITHRAGLMAYGSAERFLFQSPLSIGFRASIGPVYSWLYQANGSLYQAEIIPPGGESKVFATYNMFLFVAWNW